MSVPTKRRTKASQGRGRAHLALSKKVLNKCSDCGKAILPHCACPACGAYKGRKVVKIKIKKAKTKK